MGPLSTTRLSMVEGGIIRCTSSEVPDPNLPYTVVTYASRTAAGGVLMQDQGEGLQPLAFLIRRLKPTEQ